MFFLQGAKKSKKAILIQAMEEIRETGDTVQQRTAFTTVLEVHWTLVPQIALKFL